MKRLLIVLLFLLIPVLVQAQGRSNYLNCSGGDCFGNWNSSGLGLGNSFAQAPGHVIAANPSDSGGYPPRGVSTGFAIYTAVSAFSTSGTGLGATFTITATTSLIYADNPVVVNPGAGYQQGDTLYFKGTQLGGATPANDLTLIVLGVDNYALNVGGNINTANIVYTSTGSSAAPGHSFSLYPTAGMYHSVNALYGGGATVLESGMQGVNPDNFVVAQNFNYSPNEMVLGNGSASVPALGALTGANGIYFPSASTIAITVLGAEAVRWDSSLNQTNVGSIKAAAIGVNVAPGGTNTLRVGAGAGTTGTPGIVSITAAGATNKDPVIRMQQGAAVQNGYIFALDTQVTGNLLIDVVNGSGSDASTAFTFTNAGMFTALNYGGVATNSNSATGSLGEFVSATVASGAAVMLASASASPIVSISLTAGDWDVTGVVDYNPNAATSVTTLAQGSQALNNCMTSGPALGAQDTFTQWETAANIIGSTNPAWALPVTRLSLASTTTVCLIAKATFSVNSLTAYGTIRARRVR